MIKYLCDKDHTYCYKCRYRYLNDPCYYYKMLSFEESLSVLEHSNDKLIEEMFNNFPLYNRYHKINKIKKRNKIF